MSAIVLMSQVVVYTIQLNVPLHMYIDVQAKLKHVWRLCMVLTDRLINPGEYKPVLLTTEEHTAAELTERNEKLSS